jgi:FdhD protein
VDEAPVWIGVNGVRSIMLTCSPSETDAVAIGFMIGAGHIGSADDVRALRTVAGPGGACGVEITVSAERAEAIVARLQHVTGHGCGVRHVLDCADGRREAQHAAALHRSADGAAPPPAVQLADALRSLFGIADTAAPDGGVHAAAIYHGSALHHAAVDVARHCAVDRVIGIAALAREPRWHGGLVMTARVSGAIALKALHAGIPWIASRSIATPLAREIAAAARIPILERAGRARAAGT